MVEAFGGVLNLVIWLLLIVAGGYYAYRCLLQTKGFIDQYGFGDGAVFMTRLVGTCVGASTAVAIVILFIGPQGAWAFVVYGWIQALLAAIFGYNTVNSEWAEVEGVKVTPEGYIAPLGLNALSNFCLGKKSFSSSTNPVRNPSLSKIIVF